MKSWRTDGVPQILRCRDESPGRNVSVSWRDDFDYVVALLSTPAFSIFHVFRVSIAEPQVML
jgi:hypothetical protein